MRDNALPMRNTYRPDIDGLRAIAIIFVVGYHAFPRIFPRGFVGVDIFFVISGFLMMRIIGGGIEAGTFSFADFYARRIRRLFPALIVMLVFCLAVGWRYLFPDEFKALAWHVVSGVAFVSNLALLREAGYFEADAITQPLLHLWSLGIEEQFYIFWPLFVFLYSKIRRDVLPLTLVLFALSFACNLAWFMDTPTRAFYMPFSRLWELIIGSALVALGMRIVRSQTDPESRDALAERLTLLGRSKILLNVLSGLGFVAIVVALFAAKASRYPGGWALLPTLGTAALIAAGPSAWINKNILARKGMIFIGLISYPLYLWHWPLLSFAHGLLPHAPTVADRLAIVAASAILAYLTYRFVETPIRRRKFPWRVPALVLASAALVALALVIPGNNGFPGRFPPAIAKVTGYTFDAEAAYRSGTYFLTEGQGWSAYPKTDMAPLGPGEKRVLLWGDSFAAQLYPGMKANAPRNVRIVQRTSSRCAPILGYAEPGNTICRDTNDKIYAEIRNQRFDAIILTALWQRNPDSAIDRLGDTIAKLHGIAARIVVVGPLPRSSRTRRDLILAYLHKHPEVQNLAQVPDWLPDDQVALPRYQDAKLAGIAHAAGADYASIYRYFCKADGGECLVKTGDVPESITSFDVSGHLSSAGSDYLVRVAPELRLGPGPQAN